MLSISKIIGHDSGLAKVIERVNLVASKNIPILLHGESGSGKELIAQAIHECSLRKNGVFRRVNCGAISPELIDSELFGHEKGSFTGTTGMHRGWFEQADKGTLFLDEIGELSAAAQVRLLRVLQDGCFTRVGGEKEIKCDVRIIAATHRYLPGLIENKQFREDLYYRLSVFPIIIPPLRERLDDIAELSAYFAERAFIKYGVKPMEISHADIIKMQGYSWPGNVRELASVIDRSVLLGEITGSLQIAQALGSFDLVPQPTRITDTTTGSREETLEAVIRGHIRRVVTECHGRIDGPFGAAKRLGLNPSTLRSKMRKLGLL